MLLEWTIVLELFAAGQLRKVVPIIIGNVSIKPRGSSTAVLVTDAGTCAGSGSTAAQAPPRAGASAICEVAMSSLLESREYKGLSRSVHALVNKRAEEQLRKHGFEPSADLHTRNVSTVVEKMTEILGVEAPRHFNAAAASIQRGVREFGPEHCREAGMGGLVRATRRQLTNMLESIQPALQDPVLLPRAHIAVELTAEAAECGHESGKARLPKVPPVQEDSESESKTAPKLAARLGFCCWK